MSDSKPAFPLVLVEWVDSFGCAPGWEPIDEIDPTLLLCNSVGWLVRAGKESLVLASNITLPRAETHSLDSVGHIVIPLVAIREVRELGRGERAKAKKYSRLLALAARGLRKG